ncbi:hypothetical protein MKZ38_001198 [Zalerion maritima]|uniref:Vacuolar membrane PQ loop repeat protein n=1 Tax=Zalerion maritima TaxID=339359 RepID=A0AAD5WX27_9PEZI|nr:hypothetical protein MKZ38_001198 [Zalerion maritima]
MDSFRDMMLADAVSDAPSELNQAVSGLFGSISLTAWICLLIPQLLQNYRTKSADGLSMPFLFIWLTGDVASLSGALMTGLAPSAITLNTYFCCADVILISQCAYYNTMNARRASRNQRRQSSTSSSDRTSTEAADEQRPLLQRRRSSSLGLPGSHRRHVTHEESNLEPIRKIVTGEDETPDSHPWLHNTLSLLAVYAVGVAGWFVSSQVTSSSTSTPAPGSGDGGASAQSTPGWGLVLGYFSALCYLCARIPQIVKNWREKSCEGLALLFFLLSITGNMTYGLSVLSYSQDGPALLRALPWLLGSLGTIVEDCVIFVQFRMYGDRPGTAARNKSPETEEA